MSTMEISYCILITGKSGKSAPYRDLANLLQQLRVLKFKNKRFDITAYRDNDESDSFGKDWKNLDVVKSLEPGYREMDIYLGPLQAPLLGRKAGMKVIVNYSDGPGNWECDPVALEYGDEYLAGCCQEGFPSHFCGNVAIQFFTTMVRRNAEDILSNLRLFAALPELKRIVEKLPSGLLGDLPPKRRKFMNFTRKSIKGNLDQICRSGQILRTVHKNVFIGLGSVTG